MSKCLECDAEISQTPGRRPRKFCDNKGKCRLAHWNKNKPKKQKYVLKSTYDKIALENAAIQMELAKFKVTQKTGLSGVKIDLEELEKKDLPQKHPLYKEGDPKEGSMAFYLKYDCYTYKELKIKK